jgi:prepilin-type N-terminal cleavage/methylation domain-containing protein
MAERTGTAAAGFTLIEMLVALSILTVSITTLLLALGDSMSLRRSSDARLMAAQAVEDFTVQVAQTGFQRRAGATTDLDLELRMPDAVELPGYAGVRLSASMVEDEARPDVWLLRVVATWAEEGETMSEEFLRVLPRQLPLGTRVLRFRSENTTTR